MLAEIDYVPLFFKKKSQIARGGVMNRLACLLGPFIWECFVCGEGTGKLVESRGRKVAIGRGGWTGIRERGGGLLFK